jgi:DNA-binding NarL/FixJ family response regulator
VSHPSGGDAADQRSIGSLPDLPSTGTAGRDGTVPGHLLPQQRALLDRLANGETIAAAAAAEFLSLRTANRRIAQAREVLGARTTREAVLLYVRQRRQIRQSGRP